MDGFTTLTFDVMSCRLRPRIVRTTRQNEIQQLRPSHSTYVHVKGRSKSWMEALAGYGSDTDYSSDDRVVGGAGDVANGVLAASFVAVTNGHGIGDVDVSRCRDGTTITTTKINGNGCERDANGNSQGSICTERTTRKRRRRWDDPGEKRNDEDKSALVSFLPPPELSDGIEKDTDPFRLLGLFPRDYTTRLREDLSRQMRIQLERSTTSEGKDDRLERLNEKLERLYDRFQGGTTADAALTNAHDATASPSSFSAHLKSQREFGNPALIHSIIDHFQINPLGSHGGNTFKRFEYADRLMAAEERARVAQASNYNASNGNDNNIG